MSVLLCPWNASPSEGSRGILYSVFCILYSVAACNAGNWPPEGAVISCKMRQKCFKCSKKPFSQIQTHFRGCACPADSESGVGLPDI